MSAQRTVFYYFSLRSPWAFLGHARLLALAERRGVTLDYRPMELDDVFPASGGLPLAKRHPHRQAYRMVELKRWRLQLGLDYHLNPAFWPFPAAHADRIVIALAALGLPPEPFVSRAFAGVWQEQRNLADDGVLAAILREAGHDPATVMAEAGLPRTGEAYRANGNDALAAGVFGSPTYVLDGEPFWGQDRLDLLEEAIVSGRPPIHP